MVAETHLTPDDLIAPLFVREGIDEPHPIGSLPGVVQHTVASAVREAGELRRLGVPAVILFGVPERFGLLLNLSKHLGGHASYAATGRNVAAALC